MTTTINNNPTDPTSPLPCPPIHKEGKFVVLSDCMYTSIIPFHPADCAFPDVVSTFGSLIVKGTVRR